MTPSANSGLGLSPNDRPSNGVADLSNPIISPKSTEVQKTQSQMLRGHQVSVTQDNSIPKDVSVNKLALGAFRELRTASSLDREIFRSKRLELVARVVNLKNAKIDEHNSLKTVIVRIIKLFTMILVGYSSKYINSYLENEKNAHDKGIKQLEDLADSLTLQTPDSDLHKPIFAYQMEENKTKSEELLRSSTPPEFLEVLKRIPKKKSGEGEKAAAAAQNNEKHGWLSLLQLVSQPQFMKDLYKNNAIINGKVEVGKSPKLMKVEYETELTRRGNQIKGIKYIDVEYPAADDVSLICRFNLSAEGNFEMQVRYPDKRIEMNSQDAEKEVFSTLNDKSFISLGTLEVGGVNTKNLKEDVSKEGTLLLPATALRDIRRTMQAKIEIDSDSPSMIYKNLKGELREKTAEELFLSANDYTKAIGEALPPSDPPKASPLMHNLSLFHGQSLMFPLLQKSRELLNSKEDMDKFTKDPSHKIHSFSGAQGPTYMKVEDDVVFSRTTTIGKVLNKDVENTEPLGFAVGIYELTIPRAALEKPIGTLISEDTKDSTVVSHFKFFATREEAQAYLDNNWDAAPETVGQKYIASSAAAANLALDMISDPNLHKKREDFDLMAAAAAVDISRTPNLRMKNKDKTLQFKLKDYKEDSVKNENLAKIVGFFNAENPRQEEGSFFTENVLCFLNQGVTGGAVERFQAAAPEFYPIPGIQGYHPLVEITPDNLKIENLIPRGRQDVTNAVMGNKVGQEFYVIVQKRSIPIEALQKDYRNLTAKDLEGSTYSEETLRFDSEEELNKFIERRVTNFTKYVASSEESANLALDMIKREAFHKKKKNTDPMADDITRDIIRQPNLCIKGTSESLQLQFPQKRKLKSIVDFLNKENPKKTEENFFAENALCFVNQGTTAASAIRFNANSPNYSILGEGEGGYHSLLEIAHNRLRVETLIPRTRQHEDHAGDVNEVGKEFFVIIQKRSMPIAALQKNYLELTAQDLAGSTYSEETLKFASKEEADKFIKDHVSSFNEKEEREVKIKEEETKARAS